MPGIDAVASWAGILSLACFAGIFLGGMALSFLQTKFGPWNQLRLMEEALEEAKRECQACRVQREMDNEVRLRERAELSELKVKYHVLAQALEASGMKIQLGKIHVDLIPSSLGVDMDSNGK